MDAKHSPISSPINSRGDARLLISRNALLHNARLFVRSRAGVKLCAI